MDLKKALLRAREKNLWLKILWFKSLRIRKKMSEKKDLKSRIEKSFIKTHTYPFSIDHPITYADKLNWLKLYYRNPLMPIAADKYEVRNYLKELGYEYLLNEVLGVWETIDDFDISSLPSKFVLKSTHGSGPNWITIVKDKTDINWKAQKRLMKEWLSNSIEWMGGEWHYGEMKPRIIAEKFIEEPGGGLTDYKIHCFNGKTAYILVCLGRAEGKLKFYCMSPDWKILKVNKTGIEAPKDLVIPKPSNMEEMIRIAEDLSKPFPVVRMDFYDINNKIIFGEFTFFTNGGFDNGLTYEGQKMMGKLITLPEPNHKK
ncbi:MAG: hypothetical protein J1F07_05595 [Muribaculaceae bacterium]|nr:hypothetical protein [Muribaculaceae bacterium]